MDGNGVLTFKEFEPWHNHEYGPEPGPGVGTAAQAFEEANYNDNDELTLNDFKAWFTGVSATGTTPEQCLELNKIHDARYATGSPYEDT